MPEIAMQRFLIQSMILMFVASGIACACPTDIVSAESTRHDMHAMHGDEDTKDCCDDCDDATAMHAESLPVVIDIRFLQDDFDQVPALLPVAIDTDWSDDPLTNPMPGDSSPFLPYQTPIDRHERMLD